MAIITDTHKKLLGDLIINDFNDLTSYYFVGLGRSQIWNDSDIADANTNTYREERLVRNNLQGVKQVTDISFVVPRYNWSSGTTYAAWDDAAVGHPTPSFYVLNSSNDVYVCVRQGKTATGASIPSTIEPTGTTSTLVKTADGYVWKYIYTVGAFAASRFLAANFIPVKFVDSADSSDPISERVQLDIQNGAIPGQIANIIVTSGGTGYSSAPSVIITGDGDSVATATAVISGGSVVNVILDSNGSGQLKGRNYNYANISFSTGNATARAVLTPSGGFGANAIKDLKASAIMFNGRPSGIEGGELLIDQDFRQVSLIKDIKKINDSDFTGAAGLALNKLVFNAGATAFSRDNIVVGATSGAKAYIDQTDSAAGIWIHQTETTGFKSFQPSEALSAQNLAGVTVSGSAVLSSIDSATVNKYSGDILYVDNRAAIVRSAGETQDIKIVIQL